MGRHLPVITLTTRSRKIAVRAYGRFLPSRFEPPVSGQRQVISRRKKEERKRKMGLRRFSIVSQDEVRRMEETSYLIQHPHVLGPLLSSWRKSASFGGEVQERPTANAVHVKPLTNLWDVAAHGIQGETSTSSWTALTARGNGHHSAANKAYRSILFEDISQNAGRSLPSPVGLLRERQHAGTWGDTFIWCTTQTA